MTNETSDNTPTDVESVVVKGAAKKKPGETVGTDPAAGSDGDRMRSSLTGSDGDRRV